MARMDRSNFSADDFIMDEGFQRWVFTPDEETEQYWRAYIVANPHQGSTIEEARQFLLVFTLDKDDALAFAHSVTEEESQPHH